MEVLDRGHLRPSLAHTQTIDRAWRTLKEKVPTNQSGKTEAKQLALDLHLREAQWRMMTAGQDRWQQFCLALPRFRKFLEKWQGGDIPTQVVHDARQDVHAPSKLLPPAPRLRKPLLCRVHPRPTSMSSGAKLPTCPRKFTRECSRWSMMVPSAAQPCRSDSAAGRQRAQPMVCLLGLLKHGALAISTRTCQPPKGISGRCSPTNVGSCKSRVVRKGRSDFCCLCIMCW